MGFDPHGEVFYGYDLGQLLGPVPEGGSSWDAPCIAPAWLLADPEDPGAGLTDSWDPDDQLATVLGWTATVPFPEHLDFRTTDYRQHPDYVAYGADQDRKRALLATAPPCSLSSYGTHEGQAVDGVQLRVAVKASIQRSSYDCVRLDLDGRARWDGLLTRYCELLAIPLPAGGPGWHLTSDYG